MTGARALKLAAVAAAWVAAGCRAAPPAAQADADAPTDGAGAFVAFAPDFYGFRTWASAPAVPIPTLPSPFAADAGADASADAGADAGLHDGTLTVYWKAPPPSGSTSFPKGTIIVKETDGGEVTARTVFAMVKRGGDFNPTGAVDWEWFELQNIDDTYVTIVWRGVGPPARERYGGNPTTCNDCHLRAASNDDVWSSALLLTTL